MAEQPRRKPYSTDLTDAEWKRIEPYLETPLTGRMCRSALPHLRTRAKRGKISML